MVGTTPKYRIPYAEDGDTQASFPSTVSYPLADKIENNLTFIIEGLLTPLVPRVDALDSTDTGTVTLWTGIYENAAERIDVERIGRVVQIDAGFKLRLAAPRTQSLGYIPTGFRPSVTYGVMLSARIRPLPYDDLAGWYHQTVLINNNGSINFYGPPVPAEAIVNISGTYIIPEVAALDDAAETTVKGVQDV